MRRPPGVLNDARLLELSLSFNRFMRLNPTALENVGASISEAEMNFEEDEEEIKEAGWLEEAEEEEDVAK